MQCAILAFPRSHDMCVSDSLNAVGSCGVSYPRTRPYLEATRICLILQCPCCAVVSLQSTASRACMITAALLTLLFLMTTAGPERRRVPALFAMVFFDALAAPGRPASESRTCSSHGIMRSAAHTDIAARAEGRNGDSGVGYRRGLMDLFEVTVFVKVRGWAWQTTAGGKYVL